MKETITLTEEELREALDGEDPVSTSSWRHGHTSTYVFERDGKMWQITIQVHHEEGWQLFGRIVCTRVIAVPKTITTWVPFEAPEPSGTGEKT